MMICKTPPAKRSQIHAIELKLKDERLRQQGSLKAAHDLELKIHDLESKGMALSERAQEEFALTRGRQADPRGVAARGAQDRQLAEDELYIVILGNQPADVGEVPATDLERLRNAVEL